VAFDTATIPSDVRPTRVELTLDGGLELHWDEDQHKSTFHARWLRAYCYSDAKRPLERWRPTPWKPNLAAVMKPVSYADVMRDDGALLQWLRGLRDVGMTLMRGVPTEPGAVLAITNRIGYTRPTNFGTTFDVRTIGSPNSSAYTAIHLAVHTDLTYYDHPPGFQFFHCIQSSAKGGDSLVADGYAVAEALRVEDPTAFDTLARLPVQFRFHDSSTDYRWSGPTIGLDERGEVIEIRHAPTVTEPFRVPPDQMLEMRRAYHEFVELTRQPRFCEQFRLEPGDMYVSDNRRVLHGRTAFDPTTGVRHLQGCYVDLADLISRIRVLERA
jgi:gamma-butyrobetaine dioxygenase